MAGGRHPKKGGRVGWRETKPQAKRDAAPWGSGGGPGREPCLRHSSATKVEPEQQPRFKGRDRASGLFWKKKVNCTGTWVEPRGAHRH